MRSCKKCLYKENHPFGLEFDDKGICYGCIIHEEKENLDWIKREKKLRKILNAYKSDDYYDCIIPVSGGRDSFFIVDLIKNKYGMKPLLVAFNRIYNTKLGIRNLEMLKSKLGCEIIINTIDQSFYKSLTMWSIENLGNIYWPYIAGSTVFPVQVAVNFRIPLIILGENQAIDQVGMFSHTDEIEMTRRYRKEFDLMGIEPEEINESKKISKDNLLKLHYPKDQEILDVGVRGIYLGNFIRWDTKRQHEKMLKKYKYLTHRQNNTFDNYSDPDCQIYNGLHDDLKFRKFGYSKITDHVCREIRLKRISKKQGLDYIDYFNQQQKRENNPFFEWLGVTERYFWKKVNNCKFRFIPSKLKSKKRKNPNHIHFVENIPSNKENVNDLQFLVKGSMLKNES